MKFKALVILAIPIKSEIMVLQRENKGNYLQK
jgi:hypothetical protein